VLKSTLVSNGFLTLHESLARKSLDRQRHSVAAEAQCCHAALGVAPGHFEKLERLA
jgi:hypothetical protein